MKKLLASLLAAVFALMAVGAPRLAAADDTIRQPGDHPIYRIEGEPHVLWGWADFGYAGTEGVGVGGRLSFPILDNGFIKTINNSVAITAGLDWVHYNAPCFYVGNVCYGDDAADYIFLPVTMQWNFYVARKWSVFGEPGFMIYHVFYNNPCANVPNCRAPGPTLTGIDFAGYVGGRYHFNQHVALTRRLGYPTVSLGVACM
jgi:hypothetical protein